MRALLLLLVAGRALAEPAPPPVVREVDIEERLGEAVELGTQFIDERGKTVRLAELFDGKRPVVLTLAYFRCPMLCDLVLRGLADALRDLAWQPGRDFRVVTVSIDPRDKPDEAANRRRQLLQVLSLAGAEWSFFTGEGARALANQVGFRYAYDAQSGQYAHPAGVIVLTGTGRVSRYLYGVGFASRDLRLALVEAGGGRIGTIVDRVLITCYRYDPATRRYALLIAGVLRGGSLLILIAVAALLTYLWRRERRGRA